MQNDPLYGAIHLRAFSRGFADHERGHMRLLRLLSHIIAISIQRKLAHRSNLVFEAALTLITTVSGLLALTIVFSYTETLAGWRLEEVVILLGMFQIVSGLLNALLRPKLDWFESKVFGGQLDDMLRLPVSSLFLASLSVCEPWAFFQGLVGLIIVGVGVAPVVETLTLANILAALFLLACGVIITWASRVLLACLAFFAPGAEPTVLYDAFWQLGRYPVGVYQPAVRRLLTYAIPVAFISSIPARTLVSGANVAQLGVGLAAAVASAALAWGIWRQGLRRYTSATS
jgi:ABC-2 type transport system permease protein